ncbi:receptor-like protein 35 [Salvia splendens]|uniref:receptor-like protein 35 n=1 Tax=Salvia splendens TaxID=180675 RepID=UPI001C268D9C|nr:receptor-like protein 35 [Salvia splendens]
MTNCSTKNLIVPLIFTSIFFGFGIRQSQACHPTDREALLDFKRRITSDPSKLLGNWIPSKDCCRLWDGIECDPSTGRVIKLERSGVSIGDSDVRVDTPMSGTLSPFLGNLSSLQLLNLAKLRNLTGPIPFELGKLTSLREMYLGANSLEGSIPSSIENMGLLQILSLSQNHLVGPIPHDLFKKMTSLIYLFFNDNNLSGSIPPSIGNMKSVQYIYLFNNDLSGPIPSSIGNLRRAYTLNLGNNNLSGNIPTSIRNMMGLVNIIFNNNNFTGVIPSQLANLRGLQYLD